MTWDEAIPGLAASTRVALQALPGTPVPKSTVLFRPDDPAQGFVIVLSGRIDVHLTGPTGREILLYSVERGQSCVQTTLGLMGDEPYTGEAITATDAELVIIPRVLFLRLLNDDSGFRGFVMRAFAQRMHDMTRLLERVAFGRIESRLAQALIEMNEGGTVLATHADLAARIGSAREVVTRRLDAFARSGWVENDRGAVVLRDLATLRRLAAVLV